MRRKYVYAALAFLALLAFASAGWLAFVPSTFTLTQAELQQLADKRLPMQLSGATVEQAEVYLADNRARVLLHARAGPDGDERAFTVDATVVPRYEPLHGAFYLTPNEIRIKRTEGANPSPLTEKLTGMAERYFPGNKGAMRLAEDVAPKISAWLQAHADGVVNAALERVPVYTLPNDMKGLAARAVLDDVVIEGNVLVAHFTLWRLTWWVLVALFLVLFSLGSLVGLMRYPGVFFSGAILSGMGD